MESSSIEPQDAFSTGTMYTNADSCSQEHITQFNEKSDKIFVPCNDTVETTRTGVIPNSTVTMDNVTITDASGSTIKSPKFSIEKYQNYSSLICLVFIILFVIAVVLVPVILYYTISPQEESFLDDVDFRNCSVSTVAT